MDVINLISKVPGLPDAPITDPEGKYQVASEYYANGCVMSRRLSILHSCVALVSPRVHEFLKEMNKAVLSRMSSGYSDEYACAGG